MPRDPHTPLDHYTHNYCTISADPTCLVIILPGKAEEREGGVVAGAGSVLAVRRHISLVIPGWCLWTNLKRAIAVSCNTLKALHKVSLHHLSGGPPINQYHRHLTRFTLIKSRQTQSNPFTMTSLAVCLRDACQLN